MSYFKKIIKLVEGRDVPPGSLPVTRIGTSDRDDELAAKVAAQLQRDRENDKLERQTRPSGESPDQQIAPYRDIDDNVITTDTDTVKNRQSWKSNNPEQLRKDAQTTGTGVHGSPKKFGIGTLSRAAGTIQGLADAMDKGMPVIPAKDRPYEDESGNLLRFGQITTGLSNGDPYYFEFDHKDRSTGQHLVLYGRGAGDSEPASYGRPIPLHVKAIIPPGSGSPVTTDGQAKIQECLLKIKKLTEGTTAAIARPGATVVPTRIMNHPQIVSLLKRFKLLDEIETRVKVGGVYGLLVRKDPGDKNSIWKLTKKIHDNYIPDLQITPEWEDDFDNNFGGPGAAAAIGPGALGLAAAENGLEAGASGKQVARAMGNYTKGEGVIEIPAKDVVELPDDDSVELPDRKEQPNQPDEFEDEDQETTKPGIRATTSSKTKLSGKKQKISPIPGTKAHKDLQSKKEKRRKQNRDAKRRQRARDRMKKSGATPGPGNPNTKRSPGRKPSKQKTTSSNKNNTVKFRSPSKTRAKKVAESLTRIKRLTSGDNT